MSFVQATVGHAWKIHQQGFKTGRMVGEAHLVSSLSLHSDRAPLKSNVHYRIIDFCLRAYVECPPLPELENTLIIRKIHLAPPIASILSAPHRLVKKMMAGATPSPLLLHFLAIVIVLAVDII